MADKLVALLGSGDGPRMFTGRMRNLVARVVGLTGNPVRIVHDSGTEVVTEPGNHQIPDSEFVQFHHEGKSKTLICTLRSQADAVSSP